MTSIRIRAVARRLRSEGAETIAETLVGILIASLSMALLASATAASTVVVQKTRAHARDYYAATSSLAAGSTGKTGGTVAITPDGPAQSLGTKPDVINVTWNEQEFPGGRIGVSYGRQ